MNYVSIRCLFMRVGGASFHSPLTITRGQKPVARHHRHRHVARLWGRFYWFLFACCFSRTTFRTDSPYHAGCTVVHSCSTVRASTNCSPANCWDNTKRSCNRYKTMVDAYRRRIGCGTAGGCSKSIRHCCTLESGWNRTDRIRHSLRRNKCPRRDKRSQRRHSHRRAFAPAVYT